MYMPSAMLPGAVARLALKYERPLADNSSSNANAVRIPVHFVILVSTIEPLQTLIYHYSVLLHTSFERGHDSESEAVARPSRAFDEVSSTEDNLSPTADLFQLDAQASCAGFFDRT